MMDDGQDDGRRMQRLGRAVESSYRKLLPFRNLVHGLVSEYAGPGYGDNETVIREKYVNLMNQTVDAYMMLLAANTPRVLVSTHDRALTAFAQHFTTALNNLLKKIDFGTTHHDWVMDAFFCVGVLKVHIADTGQMIAADDVMMDPGQPYVSNVGIDDFVYDTSAKKFSEAKFVGDMYRIPFSSLKDEMYDQDVVASLSPTSKTGTDSDRLDKISTGSEVDDDEYEPMIDLADIYVPREKMVYTFAVKSRQLFTLSSRPIAKFAWTGTKRGPYKVLGFSQVPMNVMPVSPSAHLSALDRLINNLWSKQARQAQRQKSNPVYTPAGASGARNLSTAADGEGVEVEQPNEVSIVHQGGPDPGNQQFMLNAVEVFDRMAGNLPAMLGLGTSADTVGQEKLIHASASRKEGQMQRRVLEATTDVIRELAFLLWQDEFMEIPGQFELDGFPDYVVRSDWVPGEREGQFEDYDLKIDVHSLSYKAPGERINAINGLIGQVYAPMMQMLMAQGGMIDFARLTSIYSDLLDLPRLKEIITFTGPMDDTDASGGMMGGGSPATTERRYVRQDAKSGPSSVPDSANWSRGTGAPSTLEAAAAAKGR